MNKRDPWEGVKDKGPEREENIKKKCFVRRQGCKDLRRKCSKESSKRRLFKNHLDLANRRLLLMGSSLCTAIYHVLEIVCIG